MNVKNRMFELSDKLDSFFFDPMIIFMFGCSVLMGLLFSISFFLDKSLALDVRRKVVSFVGVYMLLAVSFVVYFSQERSEIVAEVNSLEDTYYETLNETATISTKDIVNSIPVDIYYCPLRKLEVGEQCTYLEFISENQISQLFIPLKGNEYNNVLEGIEITYVDLKPEDRSFLNEYNGMDRLFVQDSHKIHSNDWSYGISIEKKGKD